MKLSQLRALIAINDMADILAIGRQEAKFVSPCRV